MNDYELLDFGSGRRLERFGPIILDRICPASEGLRKSEPASWNQADFRFIPDEKFRKSERGHWMPKISEPWSISFGSLRFELRGTSFGHLGVFPEQQENWRRIQSRLEEAIKDRNEPVRVLNLFAYTGGSSMAASLAALPAKSASVEVAHVDSSKSAVEWARRNAEQSGISNGIRYIVEDVRKFVRRELKRDNRYDAVILDPPSYGHGLKGEAWKILDHLPDLLVDLVAILSDRPVLFLLTAHTPELDASKLLQKLFEAGLPDGFENEMISMNITAKNGRKLPSGFGVFSSYR